MVKFAQAKLEEAFMRTRLIMSAVSALFILAGLVIAGTYWSRSVIFPSIDSYAWESIPDANNGTSNNFEVTSANFVPLNMRGWIQFELSTIRRDALLVEAQLKLRVWTKTVVDPKTNTGDPTGRIYAGYRILEPWTELGVTWRNQPRFTTEDGAYSRVPPGRAGWNPNASVLWMEWDVRGIVSKWLSGSSNFGFAILDVSENSSTLYSTQFFTHNGVPGPDYFPRLDVTSIVSPGYNALELSVGAAVIIGIFGFFDQRRFGFGRFQVFKGKS